LLVKKDRLPPLKGLEVSGTDWSSAEDLLVKIAVESDSELVLEFDICCMCDIENQSVSQNNWCKNGQE
jgi:hypothetical protein